MFMGIFENANVCFYSTSLMNVPKPMLKHAMKRCVDTVKTSNIIVYYLKLSIMLLFLLFVFMACPNFDSLIS